MLTRRVLALAALLAALAAVAWLGAQALGSFEESAPAATSAAPPPPKPLRIVFPEGFTIDQMAERITAVNEIAREKRNVKPKLREAEYRRLTRRSKLPGSSRATGSRARSRASSSRRRTSSCRRRRRSSS